jgi:hypothetical protein
LNGVVGPVSIRALARLRIGGSTFGIRGLLLERSKLYERGMTVTDRFTNVAVPTVARYFAVNVLLPVVRPVT